MQKSIIFYYNLQITCTGELSNEIEGYSDKEKFQVVPIVITPIFILVSCLSIPIWMKKRQIAKEDQNETNILAMIHGTQNRIPKILASLKGIFLLLATFVTLVWSYTLLLS